MSCNKSHVRDKKGTFPLPGQRSDRGKSSETLKVKNQERENLRKRMKYEKQIIREHRHILVRGQIGENQLKKKKTLKIWKGKQFVPKKRKKRNWKLIISKSWTGVGSGKSSKRLKSFYFSDFGGNCANKEPVFVGISLPVEFFFIVHAQSWVMAFEAI